MRNVLVEMSVEDEHGDLFVLNDENEPQPPQAHALDLYTVNKGYPDVLVKRGTHSWQIQVSIDAIQPQRTVYTRSHLLIGAKREVFLKFDTSIYGDNIPRPLKPELSIKITPAFQKVSYRDLISDELEKNSPA